MPDQSAEALAQVGYDQASPACIKDRIRRPSESAG